MFCPDCGINNQHGQKFCTRCGTNLIALDRARDILSEVATGAASNQIDATMILKIVALISIFGLLFTTGGTIALMAFDRGRSPIPILFGLGGLAFIVFICRYLLRLIGAPQKSELKRATPRPSHTFQPVMSGSTNPKLGEGSGPYQSITEQTTQQLEAQRRTKQ
jgi:hypothetical protein